MDIRFNGLHPTVPVHRAPEETIAMAALISTLVAADTVAVVPEPARIGTDPVLEARGVCRRVRSGAGVLRDVSVAVAPGQLVAVAGPMNSGKSTLLHCLAGLEVADAGTVLVEGKDLTHATTQVRARVRARSIGVMFQSGNLLSHLTLNQNIQLAPRLVGRVHRSSLWDLLAEFGLTRRAYAYPSQLTEGEMVRAALAVALVNDPAVLLLDEPTAALDVDDEQIVIDSLFRRVDKGLAVLVATRSEALLGAADRIVSLDRPTEPASRPWDASPLAA